MCSRDYLLPQHEVKLLVWSGLESVGQIDSFQLSN
jgi:hypothetical protein